MKEEQTVIMERVYSAPIADVWHAITDREAMKQWYFDTAGFRPEVGAEFSFTAGKEGMKCVHLCQVKEVIKNKKISYSWRYEGEEGDSLLTWELFDEGAGTRLKLTHKGLETFTMHKKEDFVAGWTYFLDSALPKFVEPKPYQCRIIVPVSQSKTADAIADVKAWWSQDVEGASRTVGDIFTVRFGETFMTFRVVEASDSKIAWLVTDCYKHWLKGNKQEWNGTTVVFELSTTGDKTQVDFTHLGLVPGIECYEGCEDGWNFYIQDSLFALLSEGKGKPNTPKAGR